MMKEGMPVVMCHQQAWMAHNDGLPPSHRGWVPGPGDSGPLDLRRGKGHMCTCAYMHVCVCDWRNQW